MSAKTKEERVEMLDEAGKHLAEAIWLILRATAYTAAQHNTVEIVQSLQQINNYELGALARLIWPLEKTNDSEG